MLLSSFSFFSLALTLRPASWLSQKTLPGSLLFLRTPASAPQVVPVCTRLMTSTPPVCVCGCKNSKVVTQNEKCFPSGYGVFSILTATPQRRRMNEEEEEEVVLEILCETSFDWQRSVTVPQSSACYWLLNSLIFWQIFSPACCLPSLGYWGIVKNQQKKHLRATPTAQGHGVNAAQESVLSTWACSRATAPAACRVIFRILIICPWLFSELLLTFKTYCMANWWKIKPL